MTKKPCPHCGLRLIQERSKLCRPCLATDAKYQYTAIQRKYRRDDPTDEELDRMIAEQLPTMPPNEEDTIRQRAEIRKAKKVRRFKMSKR